ncbi:YopX family protein [Shimazuella alba]|jgi:uncharacterized phage protein (TIGR01671 family)|uniref:YopX protein domain-containing protein n=1 Tax=Shimazuella alba TaxID=2690964 RepID=A0A6I4VW01_9BACL|nr:YopX family protein [Shimazuella alba]MXQ54788.1 hypothetical protein [Shimazuella alba]
MREIKFRVFAKDKRFPEGKIHYPDTLTQIDEVMALINNTDISLMQYTGLLDHNGKEIYEGDIIKTDFRKNAIVSFENGCFMIGGKRGISIDHYLNSGLEVIGNIHENPELLT